MKTLRNIAASLACAVMLSAFVCIPQHASAQDVSNLYMAGGSYSPGASPQFAGTALYAHQVNDSGTYAFTLIDALPTNAKPFTVTTNIGAGIAQRVAKIGKYSVFAPTSLSVAYNGQNVGWGYSSGLGVPFRPKAGSNIFLMPTARFLKSNVSGSYQPVFGLLIGFGA